MKKKDVLYFCWVLWSIDGWKLLFHFVSFLLSPETEVYVLY